MLNTAGHLVGLIPKNILLTLTEKKCWYNTRRLSMATRARAKENKVKDFEKADGLFEKLMMLNEASEKFDSNFDETEGFPATPENDIISKLNFNSEIHGRDPECERVLNDVCDNY